MRKVLYALLSLTLLSAPSDARDPVPFFDHQEVFGSANRPSPWVREEGAEEPVEIGSQHNYTYPNDPSEIEFFLRILWDPRGAVEGSEYFESLSTAQQKIELATLHTLRLSYLLFFSMGVAGLVTLIF